MGKINKVRFRKHLPLLRVLRNVDEVQRGILLNHLDLDSTDILCECVYNVIHNGRHIPKSVKRQLKSSLPKEKASLRYLAKKSKHKNPGTRRKHLVQSGRGIGAILGALVPIVTSLLFPSK